MQSLAVYKSRSNAILDQKEAETLAQVVFFSRFNHCAIKDSLIQMTRQISHDICVIARS